MGYQIFGTTKCFDTKKAERWFQERRIAFQSVDMKRFGLSAREFDSVLKAVGGLDKLVNWNSRDEQLDILRYLANESGKVEKVFENQQLIRTPIVRNGKAATVGYCPQVWQSWIEKGE